MRYKAIIAYDGTNFSGFQVQPNGRTVQGELEKTLKKLNGGVEITIFGSGRTDAGVHAIGQAIHFDYETKASVEKVRHALDTQSPSDIAVTSMEIVADDFHARYNVTEKTYQYRLDIGKPRSPFKRYYASYFSYPLDIPKMQQAVKYLEGTHDYTAFCATGGAIEDKVRTIYEASIEHDQVGQELIFTFRGNGFLYKMVRILVGTLIKIGRTKLPAETILTILESQNRNNAGPTAHPEGLYLMEVKYDPTEKDTSKIEE